MEDPDKCVYFWSAPFQSNTHLLPAHHPFVSSSLVILLENHFECYGLWNSMDCVYRASSSLSASACRFSNCCLQSESSEAAVTVAVIWPYYNLRNQQPRPFYNILTDSYLHYLHRNKQKINIKQKHNTLKQIHSLITLYFSVYAYSRPN